MMKREILVLGLVFLLVGVSFSLTVNTYDTNGNTYNEIYYDLSTNVYSASNLVIEVCNQTLPKYITIAYGDQGNYTAVGKSPVTGQDIYVELGPSYTKNNENCANATIYTIETQPSNVTYGPWSYAIVPAKLWLVMKNDNTSNIDPNTDNFYYLGNNLTFVGGYSITPGYFNYTNGYIKVKLNSASCSSTSSTITKTSSDKDHQLIVYGICSDIGGTSCSDTRMENFSNVVGNYINLYTGHQNVNDKEKYTVYYVVNGMGYPIDLGADLEISNYSIPSTVYWGEKIPISINIKNAGNVPVTDSFTVELIYNESGNIQTYTKTVSSAIDVGGTYTLTFNEPWKFSSVGSGTIKIVVDSNNVINETNEGNNEILQGVSLQPSYNISITSISNGNTIGMESNPFPNSRLPYGVNISVYQQPGNSMVEKSITLVEENGISILDPEITSNVKTEIQLNVPSNGLVTTIIPSKTSDNYALYFKGLKFYNGTDVVDEIPLYVSSTSDDMNSYVSIGNKNLIETILNDFARIYYHLFVAYS